MKTWLKWTSISGGVIGTLGAGIGIGVGIILPRALDARDALSNYVSSGGGAANLKASLNSKGHLNVVALGDSLTAGYNGYLGLPGDTDETIKNKGYTVKGEYYSYADFFVQSLRTALGGNEKVEYKNFAKSGLKLADIKVVLESGQVSRQLEKADIIPLTIGANDILALLELFHMPFWGATEILPKTEEILKSVEYANLSIKDTPIVTSILKSFLRGSEPTKNQLRVTTGLSYSEQDSKNMADKTIKDIKDISNGKVGQYLNLDEDWVDKIFKLVEREITTLIRDLHVAAPNAQIILLGHSLPFAQFPQDVLETKNPNMNNESLMQNFNKMLDSMYSGSVNSIGNNGYVDFYKMDNLSEMKPYSWDISSANSDNITHGSKYKKVNYTPDAASMIAYNAFNNIDWTTGAPDVNAIVAANDGINVQLLTQAITLYSSGAGKTTAEIAVIAEQIKGLFGLAIAKNYIASIKNNPMPNVLDIHPTVFGHSLIGKSLFKIYAKKLDISGDEFDKGLAIATPTEYNKDKDTLFEKEDENPVILAKSFQAAATFNALLSEWKNIPDGLLDTVDKSIQEIKTSITNSDGTYNPTLVSAASGDFMAKAKASFMTIIRGVMKSNGLTDVQIAATLTIPSVKAIIDRNLILTGTKQGTLLETAWAYKLSLLKFSMIDSSQSEKSKTNDEQYLRWSLYKISAFMATSQTIAKALTDIITALAALSS